LILYDFFLISAILCPDRVFDNSQNLQDFPADPSGKFEDLKDFVRSNFEICEWVGLSVVAAQVRFCCISTAVKGNCSLL